VNPPAPRGTRNGLPEFRPYIRGAARPAWMARAIRQAEQQHGEPYPMCLCGGRIDFHAGSYKCQLCGKHPA
jgi:hypothetical protein